MRKHKSRLAKGLGLPAVALCGFLAAAILAGGGIALPMPTTTTITTTTTTTPPPPPGDDGCTPGYWKQPHHLDSWQDYAPNQTLESVFDVPNALGIDNRTLRTALATGGGGVNALLRHAVAALLNSAHSNVDYGISTASVISQTNAALASGNYEATKNAFAAMNEEGCPLN
jgi:hypothetical protein